jgi:hypothetical protein
VRPETLPPPIPPTAVPQHPAATAAATAGLAATAAPPTVVTPPIDPNQPGARRPGEVAQPAARQPTSTTIRQPVPRQVERRVAQPGDRICGTCGEANDPTRKFCRRCGTNLVSATVVPAKRRPWYRRIFASQPKPPKTYAAGERIGSMQAGSAMGGAKKGLGAVMKGRTMLVGALGVLAAIGLIGYVGVPGFRSTVDKAMGGGPQELVTNIQRLINPQLEIIRPKPGDVSSIDVVGDHAASRVSDKGSNTEWQAAGEKPSLTIVFPETTDLSNVIVTSGAAKDFTSLRRPEQIQFVFDDGTSQTIRLEDDHDPQTFDLKATKIKSVIVNVISTYGPDDAPMALSELEFFRKK